MPADLWLACQNKLMRNQQIGNQGKGTHTWLSGLLKCAKCGYSLKVLRENKSRWLVCSGRYNLSQCDAKVTIKLAELEAEIAEQIERLLEESPAEIPEENKNDTFANELAELERRADRLMDAFAESEDLSAVYLHRALARLEEERQALLEAHKREQSKPRILDKQLVFSKLDFEEKKMVAAQFVRRIDIEGDTAEICWNI